MKITFPHLGNTYFAVKALFDGLGIDYIIPPPSNKRALEIGALYSPEEMCLPFKIMIGNYIQSIEKGADTILIVGSCGPCRFGEYCELQINLLKNLGYNLNFIVIDYPKDIGIKEFIRRISLITCTSNKNTGEKLRIAALAVKIINLIDKIESRAKLLAGYEIKRGQCKNILKECKEKAFKSTSPKEMFHILKAYMKKLKEIPICKSKNPLKISIIGEIYTTIEPFSNLFIEDKLMDYGVSTSRYITPSWWIKNAALSLLKLNSLNIRRASKEYLHLYIGGHARECIGEAVLSYKNGFDGAIQIFPVGCMPEIVSKSILPTISKDKNFPILTLIVDEMTGEAGFDTRIEAFLDLLERRKTMYYMGVDVGSVSTDIVIVDENINIVDSLYLRTKGRPINAIQEGFKLLKNKYRDKDIKAVGTTGSGRHIASSIIGADIIKNEITSHAIASLNLDDSVRTIIEIGGQDSKIIILENGIVSDFAMNTVCAAGTGSFLDRQAERLDIPIEEFGNYALKSSHPARIAGRCAVFAESDMIHKQQMGYSNPDIIKGLCNALVRNYLNNVAKGKDIKSKIFFQGGVAANIGMKSSFEEILGEEIIIPKNFKVMGAVGAAILAKESLEKKKSPTNFMGFNLANVNFVSKSFECTGCSNRCEVVKILNKERTVGFFGGRCEKWNKIISA